MTRPPLRLYVGPDHEPLELPAATNHSSNASIGLQHRVKLGNVLEVLRHALAHDRTWLQDFAEEEIAVSEDLCDVLATYEQLAKSPEDGSAGSSRAESA